MEIILGTSAEERAKRIYEKAVALSEDENKQILIIVPEQYTLETQKGIIKKHPRHAIMNIDVVSFNRLAYKVLDKTGDDNLPVIRETGKNMLVRKVLNKTSSALKYYSSGLKKRGFVSEMKSMLSELDQYACSPEELDKISGSLKKEGHKKISDKIYDLSLLYRAYNSELNSRFYTCEDLLSALGRILEEKDILKNSYVFFDGFTGFTLSQYKIIETMVKKTEETCFSFCYEGETLHPGYTDADSGNLFFMTDTCIKKLKEINMIAGNDESTFNITFTDKDASDGEKRTPELEFLRHDFFTDPVADRKAERPVFKGRAEAIKITEADDIKEEISLVIADIRKLITDGGYRYRDIAVVMEDIESYGDLSFKLMEQNGFPVFLDRTKSVSTNPFIENIRAFLRLVCEGFSYENVFRYIKCGFSPAGRDYADELDNYCLATGVRSESAWKKKWVHIPGKLKVNEAGEHESYYDIDRLNELRKLIYTHISKYKKGFRSVKTVSAKLNVLRSFLDEECVTLHVNELLMTGLGEETRQTVKKTGALLKETEAVFGRDTMDTEEFADMLDAAFEEMSAGFIPPSNDCIIIGDTDRTRLQNIRALFIVGVNDGIIPKKNTDQGILSDADRLRLTGLGMSLAPSVRDQAFIQKFYLYLLLTKPFDKLFLSYSRKDIQGESQSASYLIKELYDSFEGLKAEEANAEDIALSQIKLEKPVSIWTPGNEDIILSPDSVNSLYNGTVSGSISSFENYSGCPFTYFMKKGLKIYPRERYELSPADFGSIVHDILYRVMKKCKDKNILIHKLDDKKRHALVEEQLKEAEADYYILSDSERNMFIRYRIKQLAVSTLKAVGYQLAGGAFEPHGFEKRFKRQMDIKGGRLEFTGTIDRSDICISGNEVFLRIVDYKTGDKDFDLNSFYYGRQLQLVSYMTAAREELEALYPGKNVIPSALLYMIARDHFAVEEGKKLSSEEIENEIRHGFSMKGLITDDDLSVIKNDSEGRGDVIESLSFKKGVPSVGKGVIRREQIDMLQKYAENKTIKTAECILKGEAAISPLAEAGGIRKVCEYCDYITVCNHSPELIKGREMSKCSREELWDKIKQEVKG